MSEPEQLSIPGTIANFSKWVLHTTADVLTAYAHALDWYASAFDASTTTPTQWRHLQLVAHDPNNANRADEVLTTLDLVNLTGGAIDNSWTTQDYSAVDTILTTLLNAYSVYMAAMIHWKEIRYYVRSFNPLSDPKPFPPAGAPARVTPLNIAGQVVNPNPGQLAITSTDRTAFPRHWGRNYWPFPGQITVAPTTHIGTAVCSALADAIYNAYGSLQSAGFYPVVVMTQANRVPSRGLVSVSSIQVDDVFDVVRRRRISTTTNRFIRPVPTFATQLPGPPPELNPTDPLRLAAPR
jgi:hypothetical protein